MKNSQSQKGFTLIEILVVIGMIALLAAIVLIAINPARQFAQGRDAQRHNDVNAILNAIGQNIADNKGTFTCGGSAYNLASAATNVQNGATGADLAPCIVPTYISSMPFDPKTGNYTNNTSYDSKYTVMQDSTTKRITVAATPEIAATISITR